jgi:hypothetical protein
MSLIKITKNGEITYDPDTKLYEALDETYSETVCETLSLDEAYEASESYCAYLENVYGN